MDDWAVFFFFSPALFSKGKDKGSQICHDLSRVSFCASMPPKHVGEPRVAAGAPTERLTLGLVELADDSLAQRLQQPWREGCARVERHGRDDRKELEDGLVRGAVVPCRETEGLELEHGRGLERLGGERAGLPEGRGARGKDRAVGAGGRAAGVHGKEALGDHDERAGDAVDSALVALDEAEEGLGPEALRGVEDGVGRERDHGVGKGLRVERGGVHGVVGEAQERAQERGDLGRAVGPRLGAGNARKEGAQLAKDGADAAPQRVCRAARGRLDELLERAAKLAGVQQAVLDKRGCQCCPHIVCVQHPLVCVKTRVCVCLCACVCWCR